MTFHFSLSFSLLFFFVISFFCSMYGRVWLVSCWFCCLNKSVCFLSRTFSCPKENITPLVEKYGTYTGRFRAVSHRKRPYTAKLRLKIRLSVIIDPGPAFRKAGRNSLIWLALKPICSAVLIKTWWSDISHSSKRIREVYPTRFDMTTELRKIEEEVMR
jgi:hypothetical protein